MENTDDEDQGSGRGALIALAVVAVLVVGGLWIAHVLGGAAAVQDCVSSGRTNCAPVHTSN